MSIENFAVKYIVKASVLSVVQCNSEVLADIWAIWFSFRGKDARLGHILNIIYVTEQFLGLLGVLLQCNVLLSTAFGRLSLI